MWSSEASKVANEAGGSTDCRRAAYILPDSAQLHRLGQAPPLSVSCVCREDSACAVSLLVQLVHRLAAAARK